MPKTLPAEFKRDVARGDFEVAASIALSSPRTARSSRTRARPRARRPLRRARKRPKTQNRVPRRHRIPRWRRPTATDDAGQGTVTCGRQFLASCRDGTEIFPNRTASYLVADVTGVSVEPALRFVDGPAAPRHQRGEHVECDDAGCMTAGERSRVPRHDGGDALRDQILECSVGFGAHRRLLATPRAPCRACPAAPADGRFNASLYRLTVGRAPTAESVTALAPPVAQMLHPTYATGHSALLGTACVVCWSCLVLVL